MSEKSIKKPYQIKDERTLQRGFTRYYILLRCTYLEKLRARAEENYMCMKDVLDEILSKEFEP
jgi:hypothetical protein